MHLRQSDIFVAYWAGAALDFSGAAAETRIAIHLLAIKRWWDQRVAGGHVVESWHGELNINGVAQGGTNPNAFASTNNCGSTLANSTPQTVALTGAGVQPTPPNFTSAK